MKALMLLEVFGLLYLQTKMLVQKFCHTLTHGIRVSNGPFFGCLIADLGNEVKAINGGMEMK